MHEIRRMQDYGRDFYIRGLIVKMNQMVEKIKDAPIGAILEDANQYKFISF